MVTVTDVRRGQVYLVSLNPTRGREIKKTRPCVIVSPNELNSYTQTYIVAPMTTGSHAYPFRIPCQFQGQSAYVVLDQIRTVDRVRLVKRLGRLSPQALEKSLSALGEMFAV